MPVRAKADKLFFDFSWRSIRCKEYTGLLDTPENRRRCQHTMRLVDAAIRRGDFDYRAFFPRGSRLHVFNPDARPDGLMTFQEYILRWHRLRSPFRGDGTLAKDADLHPSTWLHDQSSITRHFLPAFGPLSLREVDVARVNEFRRQLVASGLSGKSVTNLIGTLHKAMTDAVAEGIVTANPVLRIRSGRRRRTGSRVRSQSDPLTPSEIGEFLTKVPGFYRTLYEVWFRLGWRSSEIVALRFRNLDFARQVIRLDTGRMPRFGGIEAEPKTGPRDVDCSYDPEVFMLLAAIRRERAAGPDDYVFTDPAEQPLSQEWLHKRVWLVTLRRAGLRERGQYNIRDSFISIALSAGEDPGWVAAVCGTSEEMIFRHYRTWIPGLSPNAGRKVSRVLETVGGGNRPPDPSPVVSPAPRASVEVQRSRLIKTVEAGGIEPPPETERPEPLSNQGDDRSSGGGNGCATIGGATPSAIPLPSHLTQSGPRPVTAKAVNRPPNRGQSSRGCTLRDRWAPRPWIGRRASSALRYGG
jgi:integrase